MFVHLKNLQLNQRCTEAGVQESTPAGVGVFDLNRSRSRSDF